MSKKTSKNNRTAGGWKVLIVDNEKDIHDITCQTLSDFEYKKKSIDLLSAFSAEEAKVIADENDDIALILLDLAMETTDTELTFVNYLRQEKQMDAVRIVLRTAQPGYAPEREIIDNYDIDDYKCKTELTSQKLYTTVRNALKNYNDICTIEKTKKSLIDAEATHKLKSELTSMIIHDLKNPLATVSSALEFWKTSDIFNGNKELNSQLDLVIQANQTILDMVVEQLKLSQIEGGKYRLNTESVDLIQLIYFIYLSNLHEFHKLLKFEFKKTPDDFPQLSLDKEMIRRVVTNLFTNALKYTSSGVISVLSEYNDKKKELTISISDSGTGVMEEDLPHIFDKFYQAENHRNDKNNFGIGLSFCALAIKTMKGTISVESKVGTGSKFTITIPAEKSGIKCIPYDPNSFTFISDNENKDNSDKYPDLKFLLVDDSNTIRKILKIFLTDIGISDFGEARNGKRALEMLDEDKYDLVFLDVTMPIMNGLEALKRIKIRTPDLPVIMLTAEHLKKDKAEGLGASCYITKPFSMVRIRECLEELNLIS